MQNTSRPFYVISTRYQKWQMTLTMNKCKFMQVSWFSCTVPTYISLKASSSQILSRHSQHLQSQLEDVCRISINKVDCMLDYLIHNLYSTLSHSSLQEIKIVTSFLFSKKCYLTCCCISTFHKRLLPLQSLLCQFGCATLVVLIAVILCSIAKNCCGLRCTNKIMWWPWRKPSWQRTEWTQVCSVFSRSLQNCFDARGLRIVIFKTKLNTNQTLFE